MDGPLPPMLASSNALKSQHEATARLLQGRPMTVRELFQAKAASGHCLMVGTPASVADQMADWFTGGACDGFNIMPPFYPEPLDDVLHGLVPELQRRGLFQTEYRGRTLRENLGLPRPAHGAFRRVRQDQAADA